MTLRLPPAVIRQLTDEPIIWLATVRADGQPQVVPVWFLWDGEFLLVYSLPDSQKVRNIRVNPRVSVHFNSDRWAEHVTRLDGLAELDDTAPLASEIPAYMAKYGQAITRLGYTPERFANEYRTLIRVRPLRLVHW